MPAIVVEPGGYETGSLPGTRPVAHRWVFKQREAAPNPPLPPCAMGASGARQAHHARIEGGPSLQVGSFEQWNAPGAATRNTDGR